ncbi:MAG: phospho-sugar mutase [Bacteroidota bacterium]
METVNSLILDKARVWLAEPFDKTTQDEVHELIENNPAGLTDAFYRTLEFGTGGLRGIMGAGTNRMNKYTVGMATQGLANYLKKALPAEKEIKMAIAYDCRNNSEFFANIAADILSSNGIKVFLFDALRPTPELSFAIRELKCHSGIVITASHNPKEYNGYKVYWNDGGQLVPPHDKNVIDEVEKILSVKDVLWNRNNELVVTIGKEIDEIYLKNIAALSLSPEAIQQNKEMKIVYTPIHGSGVKLVPEILSRFGFKNISVVESQMINDGNFPTVHSPNPEEPDALKLAMQKADTDGADLVMATDPDADRVGIAVRDNNGKMILLNGNQTGALLTYYILRRYKELNKLDGKQYIVKTIVTSQLLVDIASSFGVDHFNVLTGFKYIAEIIKDNEGKRQYIFGGEESYGYLAAEFVRDKDAVMSCALIAEMAAWAATQNMTLYQLLLFIYKEFGFYKESLLSVTKKGKEGAEEIEAMMAGYRTNPPTNINNSKVIRIADYKAQTITDCVSNTDVVSTGQPKSNVLQFFTDDGSIITVRPSGTEPKIKFYFGIKESVTDPEKMNETEVLLNKRLQNIAASLQLN